MGAMKPPPQEWLPKNVVKCACGGLLSADLHFEKDVERHVQLHQATWRHRIWWRAQQESGIGVFTK